MGWSLQPAAKKWDDPWLSQLAEKNGGWSQLADLQKLEFWATYIVGLGKNHVIGTHVWRGFFKQNEPIETWKNMFKMY